MSKKLLSLLLSIIMAVGAFSVISVNAETATSTDTDNEVKYGDIDGNSKVNIKDVTALQKYLVGIDVTADLTYADVNGDEVTDIADATTIQKYISHIIDDFSVVKDSDWRTSSIGYEIFIRSFYDSNNDGCGDFRGIAEKVDYLKSLNVGVVWLMPFNKTDSYHGYDVKDYKAVCEDYGTMEDFEYMVETLHNNGIKVVMDLVVNHTSSSNQWFVNAQNSIGNYHDYYLWGNNRPAIGYSLWSYNSNAKEYYYHCFSSSNMPDLNYNNKNVWSAVDDVADYWLDNGVDGFRLDAAMHIDDSVSSDGVHSDTKENTITHQWWQHFENHIKEKNPSAFCVGEVWAESSMQSTQARFFADLDSDFDFYLMSEIKSMAKGTKKSIAKFAQNYTDMITTQAESTPDVNKTTINSTMLDNHDVNRLAYDLGGNTTQLKFAAAVQMTLPGMPWIYYGDEIGQQGGGSDSSYDPNRREAMDWYKNRDGEGATYMNKIRSWGTSEKFTNANDGISVEEQEGVSGSLLEYYKTLTSIRNKYKIFYTGSYGNGRYFGNAYSYTVTDESRNYSMLVIHNNNSATSVVATGEFTDLISGKHYNVGDTVEIAKYQSMIIKINNGDSNPLL